MFIQGEGEKVEGEIPREINLATNIFFFLISIGCPLWSTISFCEFSLEFVHLLAFHFNVAVFSISQAFSITEAYISMLLNSSGS